MGRPRSDLLAHDLMAHREGAREQPSQERGCEPVHDTSAGDRILDAIFVQALVTPAWLDTMGVAPRRKRATHLLVAELTIRQEAEMTRFPSDKKRPDADREDHAIAVVNAANAFLDV